MIFRLMKQMKYHFDMEYNLLLRFYDYHCDLFIAGKIHYDYFIAIEEEYLKRKHLFIINLN